jgi:hypothetical protein
MLPFTLTVPAPLACGRFIGTSYVFTAKSLSLFWACLLSSCASCECARLYCCAPFFLAHKSASLAISISSPIFNFW